VRTGATLALAVLLCPSPAQAQDHVTLAQIAWSECGAACAPEEMAAIATVLRRRAERWHCTFDEAARTYSQGVFDREREDGRAWLAFLTDSDREPERWPAAPHAPWRAFVGRWRALRDSAARVLRGEVHHGCEVDPREWGGRMDYARAFANGLVLIRCPATHRNGFFVRRGEAPGSR
jgi:hypothetical protein